MTQNDRSDLHDVVSAVIRDAIDPVNRRLSNIEDHLSGGRNPSKGIHVRLDRLEQSAQTQSRWMGWIVPGLIATAIATVWRFFTGH